MYVNICICIRIYVNICIRIRIYVNSCMGGLTMLTMSGSCFMYDTSQLSSLKVQGGVDT